jgi:hypothetical protein
MHRHANHWAASAETLSYLVAFFMFFAFECNADGNEYEKTIWRCMMRIRLACEENSLGNSRVTIRYSVSLSHYYFQDLKHTVLVCAFFGIQTCRSRYSSVLCVWTNGCFSALFTLSLYVSAWDDSRKMIR